MPLNFTAADLGQFASVAAGQPPAPPPTPNIHLISYLSSPIIRQRMQHYVVIVDSLIPSTLGVTIGQYDWTINDAGTPHTQRTDAGILEYTPQNLGALSVSVNVLDTGGATIATVALTQQVVPPFTPLEEKIDEEEAPIPGARARTTPEAAHPETSRELINDLRRYADAIAPPASDDLLDRLLLSIAYSVTLRIPQSSQVVRNTRLENAAREINNGNHAGFLGVAENGIGLGECRPHVLAMCLNKTGTTPYIPFVQIPARGGTRNTALAGIRTAFNALPETEKIDLFNLLRFPKTHFRMMKTVLERMRDEYFNGQVMQTLLGDRTKIERLITEYQEGGISAQVRGLMSHPVWAFMPPLPAGAGGAPVTPPGPTTPPNIGSFEKIPEQTFVAAATPTDNGFIITAFTYHETYGLNPQTVTSFEDLLTRLSAQATHLQRIRIVSHFSLESESTVSSIMIPFFAGQTGRGTEWWHFKFGISKEEGLKAFYEDRLPRNYQNICDFDVEDDPAHADHKAPLWRVLLKAIRTNAANAPLLAPFALSGVGSVPTGNILRFVKFCGDLFVLNTHTIELEDENGGNNQPMPAVVLNARRDFINAQIDALLPSLTTTTRTVPQINALRTALISLLPGSLPVSFNSPMGTQTFTVHEPMMLTSHPTLIANLNTVKARFDASSFVDIRGCRVGQDARYMNAVRDFFSPSAAVKPTVSAPEWFQSFTLPGNRSDGTVTGNPTQDEEKTLREDMMRGIFTGGGAGFTAADVQREYSNWSGRIGINAHIAFWQRLTSGDPLEFLEFAWRNQIPALAMDPVRLRNFSALAYPAAVARLAEIFNLLDAAIPAPADLTTFATNLLPHIPALRTADRTIVALTPASPQGDLNTANTAVQAVATSMGQTLPAAPSPVTLVYLQTSVGQLKTHATTHPNIAPFLAAIQTKVTAAAGGYLYQLFIGLPLFVQAAADENTIRYIFLQAVREEAMRSFMRIHWADPLPVGNQVNTLAPNFDGVSQNGSGGTTVLTDLGRMLQMAALSNLRTGTNLATNPNFEFHQHIVSLP